MKQVNMSQDYCENALIQANVHINHLPRIQQAVQEMINKNPQRFQRTDESFVIADLGCADGKNSVVTLQTIIQLIRTANSELPIVIYLTDTPSNDFTKAMKAVKEGLQRFSDICIFSEGRSFYEKLFPQKSVDLILSFSSVHWCSRRPTTDKGLMHFFTEDNINTPSSEIMLEIANEDWKNFMLNREKELKPQGRLLVSTCTTHKELKPHDKSFMFMYELAGQTMHSTLADHGLTHIQDKIGVNMVCRKEDHFKKIFEDKETRLQLLDYQAYDVKDPFMDVYEADKDKEKYASKYSQWVQGFTEEVYRAELQREEVSGDLIERILRAFYSTKMPAAFIREFDKHMGYMTFNIMIIENI